MTRPTSQDAPFPAVPPDPPACDRPPLRRTLLVTEVLWSTSDPPPSLHSGDLEAIADDITAGPASGATWVVGTQAVSPATMGHLLRAQGSDSGLLGVFCSFCEAPCDDGDGYDGMCGNCADLVEVHDSHRWHHEGCPVCQGAAGGWA